MPARMGPEHATQLSVVVVTYNSRDAVAASLPALCEQLAAGDQLVVVDNASSDDTPATVRTIAPQATILRNQRNLGFAVGANLGARAARGDPIVFLNPDATPSPGFVEAIRTPRGKWAAWMGLVTAHAGRVLNTTGGVIHFTGIAWAGDAGLDAAGMPREPREAAFLSGACLAITRAEWDRVGGFSDEFFMYHEDVDLSLRIRLAGGSLGIEPEAVVDHDYAFTKGTAKWRLLERNRWSTILRCFPGPVLVLLGPALLATEVAILAIAAAGGWLPQKLAAAADSLRAIPRLLRERGEVQATRTISSAEFAEWLTPDLDSAFLGRVGRIAPLRIALRAYWRVVVSILRSGAW